MWQQPLAATVHLPLAQRLLEFRRDTQKLPQSLRRQPNPQRICVCPSRLLQAPTWQVPEMLTAGRDPAPSFSKQFVASVMCWAALPILGRAMRCVYSVRGDKPEVWDSV